MMNVIPKAVNQEVLIGHDFQLSETTFENNHYLLILDGKYYLLAELLADENNTIINV